MGIWLLKVSVWVSVGPRNFGRVDLILPTQDGLYQYCCGKLATGENSWGIAEIFSRADFSWSICRHCELMEYWLKLNSSSMLMVVWRTTKNAAWFQFASHILKGCLHIIMLRSPHKHNCIHCGPQWIYTNSRGEAQLMTCYWFTIYCAWIARYYQYDILSGG